MNRLRRVANGASWAVLLLWLCLHTPFAFLAAFVTMSPDGSLWSHLAVRHWAIAGAAAAVLFVAVRLVGRIGSRRRPGRGR